MKSVVDFAYEIVDMHRELCRLRGENEDLREYRNKYMALLNSDIEHSQQMSAMVLGALLDDKSPLAIACAMTAKERAEL